MDSFEYHKVICSGPGFTRFTHLESLGHTRTHTNHKAFANYRCQSLTQRERERERDGCNEGASRSFVDFKTQPCSSGKSIDPNLQFFLFIVTEICPKARGDL